MLRVTAYCRVSTDKDDQSNSFESQRRYFEEYIIRNPDWKLVGIYADEGMSGTSTQKRKAFNKMISDARLGKFDFIITKEVSRFARNTVDTLQYTRELKALHIGVYFVLDQINTMDTDGELRLTIMASLAQEESRKTSERVKWGQKRQMEKGVVFGRSLLGYDVHDGRISINQTGAEIVKQIFHKYVDEQKGTCTIARELREAGYKTVTGNTIWSSSVILKILRNEKYCGDLVQRKTYTPDYLTHQKKYNHGEVEVITIKNHHAPIISRNLWLTAQAELNKNMRSIGYKNNRSNRYPLSGKILCGYCGKKFVARSKARKNGSRYIAWKCYEATLHGALDVDHSGNQTGCKLNCQIKNENIMSAIQKAIQSLHFDRETIIQNLLEILQNVLDKSQGYPFSKETVKNRILNLSAKKERLLDIYLSGDISKEEYQLKNKTYAQEISILDHKLQASCGTTKHNHKMEEIKQYLHQILYGVEQDDLFYKNLVKKIVVHERDHFEIFLTMLPHRWKMHFLLNNALILYVGAFLIRYTYIG